MVRNYIVITIHAKYFTQCSKNGVTTLLILYYVITITNTTGGDYIMSDKLDKVLQIRLSSREQEMIKRAFVGTNVSNMVRMYLITEAEKILENFEMEEVDDFDKFRKYITQEETIKELYESFKINK